MRLPAEDSDRLTACLRAVGQVAGAAAFGAGLAVALIYIWHTSLAAERASCSNPDLICIGPDLIGIAAGVVLTVGGSALAFALLRIRPVLAAAPLAALFAGAVLIGVGTTVPGGGRPPSASAVIPVLAAGYALLAVVLVTAGRLSRAAGVLLVASFLATLLVPWAINGWDSPLSSGPG